MSPVIGLDFGTTNSAIAVADAATGATLARFGDGSNTTASFRSILYFPPKDRSATVKAETKAGPEAISSYLDDDTKDDSSSPSNPISGVACSPLPK
jgi:hypothetical chaperone protein